MPKRSPAQAERVLKLSALIRRNAQDLFAASEPYFTRHEFAKRADFPEIYNWLRQDSPRHNVGIDTVVRVSHGLGIPTYGLLLPRKKFRETILKPYAEKLQSQSA